MYIYIWVSINGYPNSWLVDNGKSENIMDDFGCTNFKKPLFMRYLFASFSMVR